MSERDKTKQTPAPRSTRSQSTTSEHVRLESHGRHPIIAKVQSRVSESEDSFQSSKSEETLQNLSMSSHSSDEEEFNDNTFIIEIDKQINSGINITDDQSDSVKIENYKKIINNYQAYLIDQTKKNTNEIVEKDLDLAKKEQIINNLREEITQLTSQNNRENNDNINNDNLPPKSDNLEIKEMEISAKDAILAIPVFSGEPKELDTFINTCDLYNQLIEDANKPSLLLIIKAKIKGEALAKVAPLDPFNTWELLKAQLRAQIKKPISFEFAQEDLSKAFQKKDESMEDYAKRFRGKLQKLNEASRAMAPTAAEKAILQKANEKLAISKFEQNIRDDTVRILVTASAKTTLDQAIQIALHKDLMEKNKNNKNCGFCGLANHSEEACRKKKASENQNKPQRPTSLSFKKPNFPKNESNDRNSTAESNDQFKKSSFRNPNNNGNNNGNFNKNNNQKSVRFVEEPDTITLQEALDEEEDSDSSKN